MAKRLRAVVSLSYMIIYVFLCIRINESMCDPAPC